jgi:hypothetical protein
MWGSTGVSLTATNDAAIVNVVGERTEMPRPLRRLPSAPNTVDSTALRNAAKKQLGMSDRSAAAMSTMWVDPAEILPQIGQPRRMRIPGGDLLYVEGQVWTPRLMADPTNPRNAANYLYPMAEAAPKNGDPAVRVDIESDAAEVRIKALSRNALSEALATAMEKTRANNQTNPPIADQGIMDAPFGVMTLFTFNDSSADIAVPHVREGSTRTSWAQHHLGVTSTQVLFEMSSLKALRQFITDINAIVSKPAKDITEEERARVRCATTRFVLIVGFDADRPGSVDLAGAIKVKVAQEHLNTKTDWSSQAQSSAMADDCLEAASNAGLFSDAGEYEWLLGRLTRKQAATAGYASHPDDRFTRLAWLFTTKASPTHDVIRRPIAFVLGKTSHTKVVQVRRTAKIPLAAELVARELRGNARYPSAAVDRIARVLADGAGIATRVTWTPTDLSIVQLEKTALKEIETGKVGAAGAELAVRALYYCALHDTVRVPRNDQGPNSDRRPVSDLLEDMLSESRGVRDLARIIKEGRLGKAAVQCDDSGNFVPAGDGQPIKLENYALRYELYPKDGHSGEDDGDIDPFLLAQRNVAMALRDLKRAMEALEEQADDEGNPIVTAQGIVPLQAREWRKILDEQRARVDAYFEAGVEFGVGSTQAPSSVLGVASGDEADGADNGGANLESKSGNAKK